MAVEIRPFGELFADGTRNGLTRPKAVRGAGVKMVNMGELFAHSRLRNADMDRVPLSDSEAQKFLLKDGDLLFARQSLVLEGAGKCSIFLSDDEPVTFESHVTRVRLDRSKADPRFYFYYLQSHHGKSAIRSIVEQGAGASGIRGSDLQNLGVLWMPPPEQRAIAHILGTLDDKIELNRRRNQTLEAMARALFKDWFVDFGPVRAKMNLPSPAGRWAGGEGPAPTKTHPHQKLPLPDTLRHHARQLRGQATDAEQLLWRLLRGQQIEGAKFRRQHPLPPYILDFYCHELKLAVELDGGQHNEPAAMQRDARRTAYLQERGIEVLRFWNNQVLGEAEAVLEAIYQAVLVRRGVAPSPPAPLPEGEGRYLPREIWDLFPDRLDDEGKPEGWETTRVFDYLSLAYGKSLPAGKRHPGGVPVYGSGGITGFHSEALVNEPAVIVGRKGTVGSLYWEDRPCFPIDTVFFVQPEAPLPFCYYLLESLPLQDMNTDAAVPGLNRENVYRLEVAAPPTALIAAFAETASRFRETIAAVSGESETLAQLRDTLLPKLISGELRIADAERLLEKSL